MEKETELQRLSGVFPKLKKEGRIRIATQPWFKKYTTRILCSQYISPDLIWYWAGTHKIPLEEFIIRRGGNSRPCVYFTTKVSFLLEEFIKQFEAQIFSVSLPISEAHQEKLENVRNRIKPNLYFSKYRYKIRMLYRNAFNEKFKEVDEWVITTFQNGKNNEVYYRSGLANPTIFFRTQDTVVLFKLMFPELICSIEQIVLIAEVED